MDRIKKLEKMFSFLETKENSRGLDRYEYKLYRDVIEELNNLYKLNNVSKEVFMSHKKALNKIS